MTHNGALCQHVFMDNQQPSGKRKCIECGTVKPVTEFYKHGYTKDGNPRREAACKECRRPYLRRVANQKYRENPERYRGYVRKYRRQDPDRYRAMDRAKHRKKKLTVLDAYGGRRCACCGIEYISMLTIDHVNNDGAKHRKQMARGKKTVGSRLYQWLISHGFPPGFQVLCFNCNSSKHTCGGVCEHKRNTEGSTTIPKREYHRAVGKAGRKSSTR